MSEETTQDTPKEPTVPAAAAKPQKPKARLVQTDDDEKKADLKRAQRRKLVGLMMTGYFLTLLGGFMRFFFPRTLTEPKTKFPIGPPSDYEFGVDTKWQASQRIWVVKNAEGLFVILAKCTHLGCTPDWKASENKFKCPCHGSGFTDEGINFEGPAPRPLDRCDVSLNAQGEIVVDKLKLYSFEQFDAAGSKLSV